MNAFTQPEGFGAAPRLPPMNARAEQALLGALLANNAAYGRVSEFLQPHHFADALHGAIYAAIQRRVDAGQVADAITLWSDFADGDVLEPVGGRAYLAELLGAMVGVINAGEYGRVILDCWQRRQLIEIGEGMVNAAHGADPERGPEAQIEGAEAALMALAEGNLSAPLIGAEKAAASAVEAMQRGMASKGGLIGIDTGLRGVNRMTKGFRPGQFIVVGGRPSMGKTAFAGSVTIGAAKSDVPVLFVTAEMDASDIMARMIAAEAGVSLNEVLTGHRKAEGDGEPMVMSQAAVDAVVGAQQVLSRLPIEFEEASSPSVPFIRGRARRMLRQRGLGLIVVDYLGLLRASDVAARQNRNEAVSEISRGLKAMARELRVPVLALAQLNRESEKREGKRPQLSDLRDSGSIEQDADVVGFVHRPHYYLAKNPPSRKDNETQAEFEARQDNWAEEVDRSAGKAELILHKQRQGETGIIRMNWNAEATWFFDTAQNPAE
ncbi:replicative DNA helicase [Roseomonas sp. USHLN139]|uniref:replicative DNA helicase n=1 Tax=Roseomonas sp. USHLN139 TaxID=3081298 RepID=UPI003B010D1C